MTISGEANGNKMVDLIGIRGAARALGLSPSTISRYLKSYPELDCGGEAQPKVDVNALRRHRAQNVHPAARGIKAARLLRGGEVTPAPGPVEPPLVARPGESPNYYHAKAVRETVLAQRARVDLDEKRGLLVPRAEVEDAVFESGLLLQRNLLHLCSQVAERLASMSVAREITEVLEGEVRKVLAELAASLRAKAEEEAKARPPPR